MLLSDGPIVSDHADGIPNPEVLEKPTRRRFDAPYKLRILQAADHCTDPGQLGALLRRVGLYCSLLATWRRQRDQGTLRGLTPKKRGRKAKPHAPLLEENRKLQRNNQRLRAQLDKAQTIIEFPKKLSEILGIPLNSPDKAPAQVHATLLDQGTYLCSVRTMYRILDRAAEVRERRNQLRHPAYRKPELLATAPNQVWSWDITKLLGPAKWTYFYLYVLLTIHRDRGAAMKSQSIAQLLASLGVTKSFSRPNQSNDNPFSESQFKTLKYRPDFPDRFGSQEDALAFCRRFLHWYNHEHYHSGIGMLTPTMVHYGAAPAVLAQRQRVLQAVYAAHHERFVNRSPSPGNLPHEVWINPPVNRLGESRRTGTPAQELLVETDTPSHASPEKNDRTISRITSADQSGRFQTRPEFQVSLINQSSPAATGMRVEGGSGGEGPRLPPIPITPCGAAAPSSSQLPPLTTNYTNFQRQLSQNH